MMSPHEYAVELINKAMSDEYAIDKLIDDPQVDDAVIGFHCQQAAEKLLKALLAERGVYFQRSHNLSYLMTRLSSSGMPLPSGLTELDVLNPFAVTLRYETLDAIVNFDRNHARTMIQQLHDWVEGQVQP